jgi:AraC-like DNA-binding protein
LLRYAKNLIGLFPSSEICASVAARDIATASCYHWRRPVTPARCTLFEHAGSTETWEATIVVEPEARHFHTVPSATGSITRLACTRVKAAGIDPDPLLQKARITQQQIDDPSLRINVRDQISFLNLAADALEDDLLGFHLALPFELREIGLLYYVAASSETLAEALQQASRYSSIANEGVSLKYGNGQDVGFTYQYVGVSRYTDRHQIEFFATTLVRICRHLTRQRIMPVRVKFTHRREAVVPEVVEVFGDNLQFGAPADEVMFAPPTGQFPIVSADPYLNRLLIKYCEEALARRPGSLSSFRSAVENAIVPLLPHARARAAEIASRLGVSQRTFARRLALEGVTFTEVLEHLKSDLAQRYLADETLSISQIAWLLGYQEVSAFTHAFKRWTGKTPREARSSS